MTTNRPYHLGQGQKISLLSCWTFTVQHASFPKPNPATNGMKSMAPSSRKLPSCKSTVKRTNVDTKVHQVDSSTLGLPNGPPTYMHFALSNVHFSRSHLLLHVLWTVCGLFGAMPPTLLRRKRPQTITIGGYKGARQAHSMPHFCATFFLQGCALCFSFLLELYYLLTSHSFLGDRPFLQR